MPGADAWGRSSDEELMLRVQDAADEAAFGCLYDRHAHRAHRIARSFCGDTRAEDAVQEGFLSVWRRRTMFEARGRGSFRAWSMRVVRHAAIDTLRRETNGDRLTCSPLPR